MIELAQQFIGKAQSIYTLYNDQDISDILINGCDSLFVERLGVLENFPNPFTKPTEVHDFIERLLVPIGRRVDAAQPYLDGRLTDGGRFHVILPPIASNGPYISIRKQKNPGIIQLSDFGPESAIQPLLQAISARKNILVVGGTGAGKTTLLGRLLDSIAPTERIAIIEETAEIRSSHPHLIFLETRPASAEGIGEVTQRTLVKNVLRMRPDRLVIGECRGEEAFDMLQALNTGHAGSLGTIHANGPLDALNRLESLVLLTGYDLTPRVIRVWIAASIDFVVFLERNHGHRSIREILEITGLEGDLYRFLPLFQSPGGFGQRSRSTLQRLENCAKLPHSL